MSEPPPTTPNHCGKCGASAYPGANYCQNCGKSISLSDEPFDIEERLIDIYPTYMVTLISIIQAAALGYLLLAAKDQLSNAVTSAYDPIWTILIIGMFVMIVATWIQYSHAVLTLQLTPTTLGALVPFLFGVTQALAIFSINLQQSALFYFSMSLTPLLGSLHIFPCFVGKSGDISSEHRTHDSCTFCNILIFWCDGSTIQAKLAVSCYRRFSDERNDARCYSP
jgi:hypothetical protein